jgi:hypothetical protein
MIAKNAKFGNLKKIAKNAELYWMANEKLIANEFDFLNRARILK